MAGENLKIMREFGENNMPNLDVCVLGCLELFIEQKIPALKFPKAKRPLVVGSGNAAATGKIVFGDFDGIYADESSYKDVLKKNKSIDFAFIVSASGSKHAGGISKEVKKSKIPLQLFTSNKNAPAIKEAKLTDKEVFIFPSNPEPYTYNTSTYGSMIFAKTKEDPKEVLDFIKGKVDPILPNNLGSYSSYAIIVPARFNKLTEMFRTKFDELFGLNMPYMVFTDEQMKHAKDVCVPKNSICIEFGETVYHLRNAATLKIPLPAKFKEGALMMISYYVVGKIQAGKPSYFKDNIVPFCKDASLTFGKEIKPIVRF